MLNSPTVRRALVATTLAACLLLSGRLASPALASPVARPQATAARWTDDGGSPWAFVRSFLRAVFGQEGSMMDPLGGH